ncbi:MAG TPA: hypothetical protein VLA69_00935, partial [Gaiellaceae bacterium]|nr:hypothetical protein [Gaiellaceae bacterium]
MGGVAFDGVEGYPELLRRNASEYAEGGTSVAALVLNVGGSVGLITVISIAAGMLAVVAAWHRRDDDLACFSWTVAAAFLVPIVWVHYYALLLVPLALATPHLSRAWLLPFLTTP